MKKNATLIIFITLIAYALGILRDFTLSYFYGATSVSDAYLISVTIPNLLFAIIGSAITAAFIPVYTDLSIDNNENSNLFVNRILIFILAITSIIVIMTLIFTQEIVFIFSSGFDETTSKLAINLTRVMILSLFTVSIVNVFKPFLNSHKNFIVPAMLPIPLNIVIILSIWLSVKYDIMSLAYGYLFGVFLQLIIITPFVLKKGFKLKIKMYLYDENLYSFIVLAIPIVMSVAISDINKLVDRTMASNITGGISALSYASKLNHFIQGFIVNSIVTVTYPSINKNIKEANYNNVTIIITKSLTLIIIAIVPIVVVTLLFSEEIIAIMYLRGSFDIDALNLTSGVVFYYAFGMFFISIKQVLIRILYALKKMKLSMYLSLIAVTINITLNIIFFFGTSLRLNGLALATSISNLVIAIMIIIILNRDINFFDFSELFITLVKVLILSTIIFLALKYYNIMIDFSNYSNSNFVLMLIIGSILYLFLLYFLNIKEYIIIVKQIILIFLKYLRLFKKGIRK